MKEFSKILGLALSAFLLFSCSSEELSENLDTKDQSAEVKNILSFKSEEEFLSKVEEVRQNESDLSTKKSVTDKGSEDFESLYNEFSQAMEEADEFYQREGGYEEFKKKFPNLYYPEYGDDYSAYLPVSDEAIAKLVNKEGKVIIGGKLMDLRDIFSYRKLQELGLAIPEDNDPNIIMLDNGLENENISKSASLPINKLPQKKSKNRKLWVKTSAKAGLAMVEVCFRKRGAFRAWYNYSTVTTLKWDNAVAYDTKKGHSSHDYPFYRKGSAAIKGVLVLTSRSWGDEQFKFVLDYPALNTGTKN